MQKDYRPKGISHIDIFKDDWNTVVNILRGTEWFVTGRHHELYASCKARCYFSALDGNTHKNVGLMKTAGVEIPIESPQLIHSKIPEFIDRCKEQKKEYDLLFRFHCIVLKSYKLIRSKNILTFNNHFFFRFYYWVLVRRWQGVVHGWTHVLQLPSVHHFVLPIPLFMQNCIEFR